MGHSTSLLSGLISAAPSADGGLGLVAVIGIAVIAAASLAVFFNRFRQPSLLAYIIAGFLLGIFAKPWMSGSVHELEQISHLGLVFLLFIIGLEMNLEGIFKLGWKAAAALILQSPIAIAFILSAHWIFDKIGVSVPGMASKSEGWFYFAVAVALSSTAVVVKLLGDKFDLDSQAGKISVLTLIAQDIWAVLALSYVASQGGSEGKESGGGIEALIMVGGGAILATLMVLFARYVLSRVMAFLATSPDLIGLVAMGWCFLCAEGIASVGLSAEMGALIAGLSLGSLPSATEVLAKVSSLRDFFMALFFVALGMALPLPTSEVMIASFVLAFVVIAARFILFAPTLLAVGLGPIVSFTAVVNLSQLSEFSLLIVPIGIASGALSIEEGSIISYAMMISVVISSYAIKNNYAIAIFLSKVFAFTQKKDKAEESKDEEGGAHGHGHGAEVVMLGYFINAEAMAKQMKETAPELISKILVVDFNLKNHQKILSHGLKVVYGDISNPETLRHHGIESAKVALCTISDTFLRGTSNKKLMLEMKGINPDIRFIATAVTREAAETIIKDGAFGCVCPPVETAPAYVKALSDALK